MQTSIRFNPFLMNSLVGLHTVIPHLQFKRHEFPVDTGNEVGGTFGPPTSAVYVDVVNILGL